MTTLDGKLLINAAIGASGLSSRKFGRDVLDVNERTVRRMCSGESPLIGPGRVLCAAIVRRPALAKLFARELALLRGAP